jgi:hypothetical protein
MGQEKCNHTRDNSHWLLSPTGVRITLVCEKCKEDKRKAFNIRTMYSARPDQYVPDFGQEE